MKQRLVLIVSMLAGLAAFILTRYYLRRERASLYAGATQISVITAKHDLPAGHLLKFDDLAWKKVFRTSDAGNALPPEDLEKVLDKKLRYSLGRGEALTWFHVEMPERARGGLAAMVKPRLRAVSVAIGGDAAVSGLVKPNDNVDVLGTFMFPSKANPGETEAVTLTVLQDVTVLATGQRLARDDAEDPAGGPRGASGYGTVTFLVTPREAELLVFAQNTRGRLTLTLRNPDDRHFESDIPDVNFQHLQQKLPELNLYRQRFIREKSEKELQDAARSQHR